jgi:hypothetical protein
MGYEIPKKKTSKNEEKVEKIDESEKREPCL